MIHFFLKDYSYNFFIGIVLFCLLLIGCNSVLPQKVQTYEWKLKSEIRTKIIKPSQLIQKPKINGDLLSFFNQFEKKIFLADMKNQKLLVEVDLESYLPKKIANKTVLYYHFWGIDSLLLLFNGGDHQRYFHDSLLVTINLKNKNILYHDIRNISVIQETQPQKKGNYYWLPLTSTHLVTNQKLLIPFKIYGMELGDTSFIKTNPISAGIYDLITSKFTILPIQFPSRLNETYPRELNLIHANSESGIVVGFSHTPKVFYFESNQTTPTERNYSSVFLPNIRPLEKYVHYLERPNNDNSFGKYLGISYHKDLKMHYRFIRIPALDSASTLDKKNFPSYSLQFIDFKNQQSSEVLIPDSIKYWNLLPFQNGFLVLKENSTTIDFDYFELIPKSIESTQLVAEYQKKYFHRNSPKGFIEYWKFKYLKIPEDGNYLLIPIFKSCQPCVEYLFKYLCENKAYWCKSDLNVILIGNQHRFDPLMKIHNCNLDCFNTDDNSELWNFEEEFFNFKLITIENQSIIDERILNPGDLKIIEKIINHQKLYKDH